MGWGILRNNANWNNENAQTLRKTGVTSILKGSVPEEMLNSLFNNYWRSPGCWLRFKLQTCTATIVKTQWKKFRAFNILIKPCLEWIITTIRISISTERN